MHDQPSEPDLLRVARPRECNTQQDVENAKMRATAPATQQQQAGLKALALQALARNNLRNNDATTREMARNNDTDSALCLLHTIRTRLLLLAASEGLPAAIVHTIPAEELLLYAEFDDADLLLPLYLRARCSLCCGKHRAMEADD